MNIEELRQDIGHEIEDLVTAHGGACTVSASPVSYRDDCAPDRWAITVSLLGPTDAGARHWLVHELHQLVAERGDSLVVIGGSSCL